MTVDIFLKLAYWLYRTNYSRLSNKREFGEVAGIITTAVTIFALQNIGLIIPVQEVLAQQEREFEERLSGANEAPPVETNASGFADFEVEGNGMDYDIDVLSMEGITQAYMNQGNPNESGPVIVTLFNSWNPTGIINGELVDEIITSANLEGELQGQQLSDLIALMNNGQTYVNVHSQEFPDGEIRGTIEVDRD